MHQKYACTAGFLPFSQKGIHLGDWSWKDGILIDHTSNHTKQKNSVTSEHAHVHRIQKVRAPPFSHTKTYFRDWSWKNEILIDHISNHKKRYDGIFCWEHRWNLYTTHDNGCGLCTLYARFVQTSRYNMCTGKKNIVSDLYTYCAHSVHIA